MEPRPPARASARPDGRLSLVGILAALVAIELGVIWLFAGVLFPGVI